VKTLILYATKHGAAKEIAEKISGRIPESEVCDLKSGNIPALSGFECVIIGSSIYAGSVRKEAKEFAAKNAGELASKQVGLFISGMAKGENEQVFAANFPTEVLSAAKAKANLGGIYDPGRAGFFEKIIMRIVTKQSGYMSSVTDEGIAGFVELVV